MFKLLGMLRTFCDKYNMTLRDLIEIAESVLSCGLPPSPENETEFRTWCKNIVTTLAEVTAFTKVKIDDQTAEFLLRIVGSDDVWSLFYDLFLHIYTNLTEANPQTYRADRSMKLAQQANISGIDWTKAANLVDIAVESVDLLDLYGDNRSKLK